MATTELVDRETGEITEPEERERVDVARVDPRFIQQRQGRPFVTYAGLLDLLHQRSKGCFSIDTLVVQLPTEENGRTAVCTARVRVFDAQNLDVVTLETSGIGDADPGNVSTQMRGHLLRMAETRAKARALRDAVNVGMAALEELGPDEGDAPRGPQGQPARRDGAGGSTNAVPPTEHLVVGDRTYSRDEVQRVWHQRVRDGVNAGLAGMEKYAGQAPGGMPLEVLKEQSQDLKRRLEAKGVG